MVDLYKKILVTLDGSEHSKNALEHAVNIATKFKAKLIMLAVARARKEYGGQIQNNKLTRKKPDISMGLGLEFWVFVRMRVCLFNILLAA